MQVWGKGIKRSLAYLEIQIQRLKFSPGIMAALMAELQQGWIWPRSTLLG